MEADDIPTITGAVGAIGDIHGEDLRLAAALGFLSREGVHRVLAVGDIVDGPGDSLECFRLLEAHRAEAVMGNHDRWMLNDRGLGAQDALRPYLEALPATRTYQTPRGQLLLCHGVGKNDMNRLTPDDYGYALETNDELQELLATGTVRFVIGGHTHRRMVKDFGGLTFINVGTLFREHDPCFAVINFDAGEVVFYDFEGEETIRESARHRL